MHKDLIQGKSAVSAERVKKLKKKSAQNAKSQGEHAEALAVMITKGKPLKIATLETKFAVPLI